MSTVWVTNYIHVLRVAALLCDMSHSWLMWVFNYTCRRLAVTNYMHMFRVAAHRCYMSCLWLMRGFNFICRQLPVTNYIHMLCFAARRCDSFVIHVSLHLHMLTVMSHELYKYVEICGASLWHVSFVTHVGLEMRMSTVISHELYTYVEGCTAQQCDMSHSWLMWVSKCVCRQLSVTNYIHILRNARRISVTCLIRDSCESRSTYVDSYQSRTVYICWELQHIGVTCLVCD